MNQRKLSLIPMINQFVPHKPEEIVAVKITKREAVLLAKLRKYPFGKFVIHKMNGLLMRLEIEDFQVISEDTEITLDLL